MGFLGQIGIDWRLLLAQILNFALLAWILTRLLYRPIVDRLEAFEKDLDDAAREKADAETRRKELAGLRAREEADLKTRAAAAVKEAQDMAEAIRGKARDESEAEAKKSLAGLAKQIDAQRRAAAEDFLASSEGRLVEAVGASLARALPKTALEAAQSAFASALLGALEKLDDEALGCPPRRMKEDAPPPLEKTVVTLESGLPLAEEEETSFRGLFEKRCGPGLVRVRFRVNPSLIAGCRASVAGVLIERHLAHEIRTSLAHK